MPRADHRARTLAAAGCLRDDSPVGLARGAELVAATEREARAAPDRPGPDPVDRVVDRVGAGDLLSDRGRDLAATPP